MQSQYLAFLACVLAIQASARPSEIARRDWVSNSKGNLIVTCKSTPKLRLVQNLTTIPVSDQTVKLGTIPISVIMSKVDNACSDNGLCQTNAIEVSGQLVESSDVYDETLTITPNGDYPTWIHNGLWEALNAAINAVAKFSKVTNDPVCPDPEAYCPSKSIPS
jgi:hypothetical protein